jgi:plastocyanin
VDVIDAVYAPNPVTIHVGDTVQWAWDSNGLSTTSVSGSAEQWDSGVLNAGATFSHTFTHEGTFAYYSTTRGADNGDGTASGMMGTITVLPPSPLMMIMVMPMEYSIAAGTTQQFMAMGMYDDNTMEDVSMDATWNSQDPSVATVAAPTGAPSVAGGMATVTGLGPGMTTISASVDDMTGSTDLAVTAATTATTASTPTPASSSMPAPPSTPATVPVPAPASTPAPTSAATDLTPSGVSVADVNLAHDRRHLVTQITIGLKGPVNASAAASIAMYRLALGGRNGSFAAPQTRVIKLKSVVYDAALEQVTLTPRKPLRFSRPVHLSIQGEPAGTQEAPSGGGIELALGGGNR